MKKAFIKMNEGKDYLSLGNLFNSIKKKLHKQIDKHSNRNILFTF